MSSTRQREREMARARLQRQAARRAAEQAKARRRAVVLGSVAGVVALIAVVALLAGVLRKDSKKTPAASPTAAAFPPVPAGADPALRTKPVLAKVAAAPTRLEIKDVIVGTGAVAAKGATLTVNYVGAHLDGTEFDASWKGRQTFDVEGLGQASVITGWNQGLVGMKVGGRRDLLIPAALAYGAKGSPPSIKPNEPLHFVVDLLAVK